MWISGDLELAHTAANSFGQNAARLNLQSIKDNLRYIDAETTKIFFAFTVMLASKRSTRPSGEWRDQYLSSMYLRLSLWITARTTVRKWQFGR